MSMSPTDTAAESVHVFECAGEQLVGVVHAQPGARLGVVFVPGGGQYRVGSHRLFVQVARVLALHNIAVLRFDHRGVGDSGGRYLGFEHLHEDLEAAVRTFRSGWPTLERIVLLGLCDGAAAAVLALDTVADVAGVVLINPWVHSSGLEARARFSTYYRDRITSREFWHKAIRGEVDIVASGRSLVHYFLELVQSPRDPGQGVGNSAYVGRMCDNIDAYAGHVSIALSGKDLVAQQFLQLITRDRRWKALTERARFEITHFAQADHTFSYREHREAFERHVVGWLSGVMPQ